MTDDDLTRAVAERVMGQCLHPLEQRGTTHKMDGAFGARYVTCARCGGEWFWWAPSIPPYATSIADAWQVVEAMRARGWDLMIYSAEGTWDARFLAVGHDYLVKMQPTPARAICLAALAAVGEG